MRTTTKLILLCFVILSISLGVIPLVNSSSSTTGYWRFEEGSPNTIASGSGAILDSSGYLDHGTPSGSPFYRSDVPVSVIPQTGALNNLSMEFDSPDDKIFFASQFVFNLPGDATLEFWLKYPFGSHETLLWGRSDCSDINRFHVYVNSDQTIGVDYRDPSGPVHPLVGPGTNCCGVPVPPDTWVHIALTRAGNTYSLYLNGVLMSTTNDASPMLPTSSGWTMFDRCGLELTGSVDEVRVSNVALAPGQFLNSPPPVFNLNRFVVLAQEGIELDQHTSVITGDVGARIAGSGPFLADGVEVSIGQQVDLLNPNYKLLGDSIFIRQGATVYNPGYNELTNNGTVLGTPVTPLDLSLIPALPALPEISPGTQNIEVRQFGALTLYSGSYGDLVVRQRATVTFTGGVYHFQSWDVGQQVNLYFLAPTEIRIADKLGVDQRGYLGPAPSATGLTARDIVLYVAGQNGQSGTLGAVPKAAVFGQLMMLNANVVAPNGTLLLRQRTEAMGAFFGRWFQAGQQVKLTLDSRFGL